MTPTDTNLGPAGLLDELRWRGLLHAATPGLEGRLATGRPIAGYNGFDPSGPSLHVGNLVPIFGLLHLQRHGSRPVVLVGGATGMIGDPSGTSAERNLLDLDTLAANVAGIRSQLEQFLDFSPGSDGAIVVNNLDWLGSVSMLDFLRDVGKHFTIPYMLAKDSVQGRLAGGLSFTEFSYMLLQAADFRHLYREYGVELQTGGADQWGNITAGLELIRRSEGAAEGAAEGAELAHALAYPLLLDESGAKFGKTAAGTSVWLDAGRTTPYAFYQYWIDRPDAEMGRLLRFFTLLRREEVDELEGEQADRPEARPAQRVLARDITARVHGASMAGRVEDLSAAVFGGRLAQLAPDELEFATTQLPTARLPARPMSGAELAVAVGAAASLGDARRTIRQGGLYLDDSRLTDPDASVELEPGTIRVIRRGKRDYSLVDLRG